MAEIFIANGEDPAPILRTLIDAAGDDRVREVVWHPETRSVSVPDDVAEAVTGSPVATVELDTDGAPAEVPLDYGALSKEQLQDEIDARNAARPDGPRIARTGTIPELIARLEADDKAQAEAAEVEPPVTEPEAPEGTTEKEGEDA
jgi:hypothetical protein